MCIIRNDLRETLAYDTFKKRADHDDVLYEFIRDIVTPFEILSAVVGKPNFASRVLPYQSFKRKIDGGRGRGQHHRCSSFRASEDDELSRVHFHANLFSLSAVIDASKDRDAARLQNGLQPRKCFQNRIRAAQMKHSVVWISRHGLTPGDKETIPAHLIMRGLMEHLCHFRLCFASGGFQNGLTYSSNSSSIINGAGWLIFEQFD